jgi:hypothetical protein
MKRILYILMQTLFLIILSIISENTIYCQETPQNTRQETIIELTHGCKLILDANIDLADTVSMNIVNGIRNILPKIQSLIPLDSIAIKLAISSSNVLPFIGVGARTNMDDSGITIEYYYDPENPNFKIESLINGLVHECHHGSRMSLPNWPLTLLELMVREGLADHFMVEVTNCEQPQWSKALTKEEIKQYMILVKPILCIEHESWNAEFNEKYFFPWMFGKSGENPIPAWTGYTLGWTIVENYLKAHPKASASSLVFTSAEEIASSTPELKVDSEK